MRVLTVGNMYPPHHLGGYELAWHSWVGHARQRGHQVRVLTTTHRQQHTDPAIDEDPNIARALPWYWHEHEFPRLGPRAVLGLERDAHQALERELEPAPDAVCWWAMGGMPLSLVESVRRRGIPSVFVVMDDWCVYGPKVDRWQRTMDRPLLRGPGERLGIPVGLRLGGQGESWIFLSNLLRERVAAAGVSPARASVVGRGADPGKFSPARPGGDWRGRLLCVGRLEERKGPQVAIAALAELPGVTLRLVGDGDQDFAVGLHELAADLGVGDRVVFDRLGRDAIPAAYAEADAVLFPVQWDEPWGFVPLEAMAVGRPVVASGTGGSAEYLRDRQNALLYEPRDDSTALAGAIAALAGDPGLRERLRDGGFETASRFTVEAFDQAVSEAIEEVGGR